MYSYTLSHICVYIHVGSHTIGPQMIFDHGEDSFSVALRFIQAQRVPARVIDPRRIDNSLIHEF